MILNKKYNHAYFYPPGVVNMFCFDINWWLHYNMKNTCNLRLLLILTNEISICGYILLLQWYWILSCQYNPLCDCSSHLIDVLHGLSHFKLKGNGICMSDMNVKIKGDLASKVYMQWSQVVVVFKFYNHLIQKRLVVHGHLYFNLLFCDRNWKKWIQKRIKSN